LSEKSSTASYSKELLLGGRFNIIHSLPVSTYRAIEDEEETRGRGR